MHSTEGLDGLGIDGTTRNVNAGNEKGAIGALVQTVLAGLLGDGCLSAFRTALERLVVMILQHRFVFHHLTIQPVH